LPQFSIAPRSDRFCIAATRDRTKIEGYGNLAKLCCEVAMTAREQILQEMVAVPEPILAEVLDFLRFLKAKQLQASPSITVVSPTGESQVAVEALQQEIPEVSAQIHLAQHPIEQVRQDLHQALRNSGYPTKESIVELVRDVKQEMLMDWESR